MLINRLIVDGLCHCRVCEDRYKSRAFKSRSR